MQEALGRWSRRSAFEGSRLRGRDIAGDLLVLTGRGEDVGVRAPEQDMLPSPSAVTTVPRPSKWKTSLTSNSITQTTHPSIMRHRLRTPQAKHPEPREAGQQSATLRRAPSGSGTVGHATAPSLDLTDRWVSLLHSGCPQADRGQVNRLSTSLGYRSKPPST